MISATAGSLPASDSAVAAALVQKAIGDRLTCVFVDHGLLRAGEAEQGERAASPGTAPGRGREVHGQHEQEGREGRRDEQAVTDPAERVVRGRLRVGNHEKGKNQQGAVLQLV